jgi:cholesterol transport system auxiliary component
VRSLTCGALVTFVTLLGSGCALLNKSDSLAFRYFTPEARDRTVAVAGIGPASAPGRVLYLRLGRVNALSYLKDRIAFRDADYEIGFYDFWQWTETPESYLRRGMQRALFEHARVHQVLSGAGPTLDLELDAFDELRGPAHAARVRVTWTLHDDQSVLLQDTVTVDRPIAIAADGKASETAPQALVAAMSDALGDVIGGIVAEVVPELSREKAQTDVGQAIRTN